MFRHHLQPQLWLKLPVFRRRWWLGAVFAASTWRVRTKTEINHQNAIISVSGAAIPTCRSRKQHDHLQSFDILSRMPCETIAVNCGFSNEKMGANDLVCSGHGGSRARGAIEGNNAKNRLKHADPAHLLPGCSRMSPHVEKVTFPVLRCKEV